MSVKYVQAGVSLEKHTKMRDRAYEEQITLSELLEKAFDFYLENFKIKKEEVKP